MIPERIRQTIAAEPLLLVAVIALAGVVLFAKTRDRWLAAVMAFAVGVAVFLTLKHFAIHYLMPVVAIVPVMIIWALSRFARRSYPYLLVAAVAAVLGIQPFLDTASTFAKARALHSENEKAIQEILAKYQNPVMIGAFRSGDRFFALQFGLGRADTKFQNLTPGILGDQLSYHSNLKKLWRNDTGTVVDWSYLDQFEKAGRAVLIVQPVHPKIEPKIVKTETLLDRGVGDSLERIIVSPKGTN